MDALINSLVQYGDLGMFISAVLAGSVLPFNSEIVMVALQKAGSDPINLLLWGTLGNTVGGVFNFWVGHLGKMEWIEKYLHIKEEKLKRAQHFVTKYGYWIGLLAWIPVLGSAITVALGYMRANIYASCATIFVGKFIRYLILIYLVELI